MTNRPTNADDLALSTIYVEERSDLHDCITTEQVNHFIELTGLQPGSMVLDVGCGKGPAWIPFMLQRMQITALTPCIEEYDAAFGKGVAAYHGTLDDMAGLPRTFDAIWARHSLEHVTNPTQDLLYAHSMLMDGGVMYVEVPAPDTVCHHEDNQNHFSVLGDRMWQNLFLRTGFEIVKHGHIDIDLAIGPDVYFYYILRKKA